MGPASRLRPCYFWLCFFLLCRRRRVDPGEDEEEGEEDEEEGEEGG